MSTLARRLAVYLFSHSHSGSLPVYSHTIRLTACLLSLAGLLSIYSLTLTQARCLSILTLSGFCLSILTLTQARCLSILLTQACCLSILTSADSPPTNSHTIRLTAIHSHSQACYLSILSLSLRLAACLFSHYQASAYLFSHHLACCLSILTPADSLPTYSHTIRLTAIYSHSIRLAAYLFSHYQAHTQVTVYLFSHPMLLRHSCSLAHQCIRALSGSLPIYSRTQTSHLSSPSPGYLVPTIRFAAYLTLVCCLATARLTTGVLSCLSIVLVLTHPHTQAHCLCSLRLTTYLFSVSLPM